MSDEKTEYSGDLASVASGEERPGLLSRLDQEIERLNSNVGVLTARLQPVSRSEPELAADEGILAESVALSDLVERLSKVTSRLQRTIEKLDL